MLDKTYKCLAEFKSHPGQHDQKNVSFKSAHACKAIEIARFQQLWLTFNVFDLIAAVFSQLARRVSILLFIARMS